MKSTTVIYGEDSKLHEHTNGVIDDTIKISETSSANGNSHETLKKSKSGLLKRFNSAFCRIIKSKV